MNKSNVRYSPAEIRSAIADGLSRIDWTDFADVDWSKAAEADAQRKQAAAVRLDSDVLDFFKKSGKGYKSHINAALRDFMIETTKDKDAG